MSLDLDAIRQVDEYRARRVWRLRLICCGRDHGRELFYSERDAVAFRETYCDAGGHERQGILDLVSMERCARAPEDVSALLAEVDRLRAKVARVEAALMEGGQTAEIRWREAVRALADQEPQP